VQEKYGLSEKGLDCAIEGSECLKEGPECVKEDLDCAKKCKKMSN